MLNKIMQKNLLLIVTLVGCSCGIADAEGLFRAGRVIPEGRDANLRVTGGTLMKIDALVEETTRSYYEVTDQDYKQELRENYDLNDFGMDDSYPIIGLSFENAGKYFSFQLDSSIMNPDVDTVAKRNYYIGIGDEVEYNGQKYDHMKIPEGTPFSMDLIGGTLELRGLITPLTLCPTENIKFTPWLDLGLFIFGGYYDLDVGPATGATQYQNPPVDFVIGGESSGFVGLGLPEIGGGGELRIGSDDGVNLVIQGHYAVCQYDGSSKYFVSTSHRKKDLDIDHVNMMVGLSLEFPLDSGRAWTMGVRYRNIESEAMITSTADTDEEIIERREKFDKHVEFTLESFVAMLGLTF